MTTGADGGSSSSKRRYGFSLGNKTLKLLTEGFQNVFFNYSASNNNNNVFMVNVKILIQHIAVPGTIKHFTPTVAYAVRILNAPVFGVPSNPEKDYKVDTTN